LGWALRSEPASAAVPERLVQKMIEAFLADPMLSPLTRVSGAVATLAKGVLQVLPVAKAKWAAAVLLAGLTVATGVGMQGPVATADPSGVAQTNKSTEEESKRKEPSSSRVEEKKELVAEPADSPLMELAREELAIIEAQFKAKQAELAKAQAQVDLASAVLARSQRLNKRNPTYVPAEEMLKSEAEAKSAEAQRETARAEVEEIEVRVNQAKRIIGHPALIGHWLGYTGRSGAIAPLETRLKTVEQKLDQILRILERPNRKSSP
jgi:hypothetical protein